MRRSIFLKLFSGYFLIIVLLTGLIFLFTYGIIRSFYLESLSSNLEKLGHSLKVTILPYLEEQNYDDLDSFVKKFGESIQTRITIIDQDGKVLADSDEDPKIMKDHKFRPEILRALNGYIAHSLRFSRTVQANMLYVGLPVERNSEITEVLRVSLYVQDINSFLSRLRMNIGGAVLIIFLISLLLAFLSTRSFVNPIRELIEASRRIEAGDFNAKVFLKNKDELRGLAESFNSMTEHIKSLFTELTQKQDELNSILSSIEEGIVVMDAKGKILLTNTNLRKLSQVDETKDKYYWEVIREPEFEDLMKKVMKFKRNFIDEITIFKRSFICSATYHSNRNEIIVSLHDITHIKNVEKMKKDFIFNVSHELRTPLTAIKGFVETLEDKADEESLNYLNIIGRNTERMINIVKDLLILSELEEKEMRLELENINIRTLMNNILKIFNHIIKKKGLRVEITSPKKLPKIKADPYKLEQMFVNIIDNAVKYTEKGTIKISLEPEDGRLKISFSDTGIGIPEGHLGRIFERFYVVDKSRSRKLGGTGLGLSIVKHITLLHNGEVNIQSSTEEGTTVIIKLPFSPEQFM